MKQRIWALVVLFLLTQAYTTTPTGATHDRFHFPQDNQRVDAVGSGIVSTGDMLDLDSAWQAPEANASFVVTMSVINTLLLATDGATSYTVPPEGGAYQLASRAKIEVSDQVFQEPTVVRYRPLPPEQSAPRRANVSVHYELEAVSRANVPVQPQPGQAYEIELGYEQDDVPVAAVESAIALYYWDDTQWVKEPTSVVDVVANVVRATPGHFSRWALLVDTNQLIYLPIVVGP